MGTASLRRPHDGRRSDRRRYAEATVRALRFGCVGWEGWVHWVVANWQSTPGRKDDQGNAADHPGERKVVEEASRRSEGAQDVVGCIRNGSVTLSNYVGDGDCVLFVKPNYNVAKCNSETKSSKNAAVSVSISLVSPYKDSKQPEHSAQNHKTDILIKWLLILFF